MINYKFIVNDYREYHVWQRERFQRIYIVWSSILMPIFKINNLNISLVFLEINGLFTY